MLKYSIFKNLYFRKNHQKSSLNETHKPFRASQALTPAKSASLLKANYLSLSFSLSSMLIKLSQTRLLVIIFLQSRCKCTNHATLYFNPTFDGFDVFRTHIICK